VAGFTLIEMLVTLTLYGVVMSVLLVGLQSGIRGWKVLARHQSQNAELAKTVDLLQGDLRRLCILSKDDPALLEGDSGTSAESLTLTVLDSRLRQSAARGAVWYRVEYSVRAPKEGAKPALVRRCVPGVSAAPIDAATTEEVLLSDVRRFTVNYSTSDGVQDAWDDPKSLPKAVNVSLAIEGRRPITFATAIPCGLYGGGAP
jgi:prepilin-type N-terminal cleavage/methylation domain-containing protein